MEDKIIWNEGSTEAKVTKFYGHGVENFDDFHGGYLNFGYWEKGNKDYVVAAETLIRKLGAMLKLSEDSHLLDVACGMGGQDVVLATSIPVKKITAECVVGTEPAAATAGFQRGCLAFAGHLLVCIFLGCDAVRESGCDFEASLGRGQ